MVADPGERGGSASPTPETAPSSVPAGLTVAAVARRLGVAPATLRTWDRRYGLGPSAHSAGSHRRYSREDVERLTAMRRLVLEGLPPGDAARLALGTQPAQAPTGTGQQGGGRVVAMPDAQPDVRGLARAALAHDAVACTDVVRRALDERGTVATWDDLLVPVLVALGDRWASTGVGVDVEHLFSEAVLAALRGHAGRQLPPTGPRPVLLACAEEEQHALPIHALATALAERRIGARVLGARVPRVALADAVRRGAPAAVFVWSQLTATGAPDQLTTLPVLRPPVPLFVGGSGWPVDQLPPGTHVVLDLGGATEALAAAAGS